MAEAIQRAGSTEAQAIIDELNKTDRDCVAGHVKFDPNGDPIKSISMIQIVGGEHKLVAKVSGN
jgi:branched-chain amino acid transport system substrate-binding protein